VTTGGAQHWPSVPAAYPELHWQTYDDPFHASALFGGQFATATHTPCDGSQLDPLVQAIVALAEFDVVPPASVALSVQLSVPGAVTLTAAELDDVSVDTLDPLQTRLAEVTGPLSVHDTVTFDPGTCVVGEIEIATPGGGFEVQVALALAVLLPARLDAITLHKTVPALPRVTTSDPVAAWPNRFVPPPLQVTETESPAPLEAHENVLLAPAINELGEKLAVTPVGAGEQTPPIAAWPVGHEQACVAAFQLDPVAKVATQLGMGRHAPSDMRL